MCYIPNSVDREDRVTLEQLEKNTSFVHSLEGWGILNLPPPLLKLSQLEENF